MIDDRHGRHGQKPAFSPAWAAYLFLLVVIVSLSVLAS